jgi:hypothetical protein
VIDGIRACDAPLAYFQPKFIVEQVLASCKFENMPPQFTPENVEDALLNLFVQEPGTKRLEAPRAQQGPVAVANRVGQQA